MRRGIIKIIALKTIANEGKISGYQLMKAIERISGRKPSSGTIYPLLKAMEAEGWIEGTRDDGKIVYTITDSGRKKMEEFVSLKNEYLKKLNESLLLAGESFDYEERSYPPEDTIGLIAPLVGDIVLLRRKGVPVEKLAERIHEFREELRRMEGGDWK